MIWCTIITDGGWVTSISEKYVSSTDIILFKGSEEKSREYQFRYSRMIVRRTGNHRTDKTPCPTGNFNR